MGHIFVTVRTTDPFPQSSLATPHLNSSFIKTPPLRVSPQGNMPSHTSPGSLSYSFCDLVNNYNKSMDPYPTPPKSNKYNYISGGTLINPQLPTHTPARSSTFPVFCSQHRKWRQGKINWAWGERPYKIMCSVIHQAPYCTPSTA